MLEVVVRLLLVLSAPPLGPAAGIPALSMANTERRGELAALPTELIALVAVSLDARSLGSLAAASAECQAATRGALVAALRVTVRRCLARKYCDVKSRVSAAQVACPYFCLPPDLLEIPAGAFQGCATLTALALPAALTAVSENAFRGCRKLTNLSLPAALTSIGDDACRRCISLAEIKFPATLETIGDGAFAGCTAL